MSTTTGAKKKSGGGGGGGGAGGSAAAGDEEEESESSSSSSSSGTLTPDLSENLEVIKVTSAAVTFFPHSIIDLTTVSSFSYRLFSRSSGISGRMRSGAKKGNTMETWPQ